jgi:hypothetical protein
MNLSYGGPPNASLVEFSRAGDVFCAYSANVTALPAYSATALGPILFNGTGLPNLSGIYPEKKAYILGIGLAVTTASAAAVAVGLTWGSQLTTPPVQNISIAATTAITLVSCTYATNKQPSCSAYNAGTVASAGYGFLPLVSLPTTALTALPVTDVWIPIDGAIVLQAGGWCALAASATATTSVLQYSIVWCESQK